jgi:hypothetical protein
MRLFELRVYTLRTKEALDFYMNQVYPRHLNSFPRFGIEAHGIWTVKEDRAVSRPVRQPDSAFTVATPRC